jgi:hypothetical protein
MEADGMTDAAKQPWRNAFVRAAGAGAGATVALIETALALYWWAERPKQWSEKAFTAQLSDLSFQQVGEELHFTIGYAVMNRTNRDYVLPTDKSGALMNRSTDNGSLSRLDGASWPTDLIIPAKQTVEVRFIVRYRFEDYNTSAAELYGKLPASDGRPLEPSKPMLDFVSKRFEADCRLGILRLRETVQAGFAWPRDHEICHVTLS